MKRYLYIYAIAVVAILAAVGCSRSDDLLSEVGYGSITILSEVSSSILETDTVSDKFEIPNDLVPMADDLQLRITGSYYASEDRSEQSYDEIFENTTEFNSSASILWGGSYAATLYNGIEINEEGVSNPSFCSESTPFTIVKGTYNGKLVISVKLVNSIIRLSCSEWFKKYFSAATFTITTAAGNSFDFDPFDEANDSYIVFVSPDSELTLKGTASRVSGGSDVTFNESVIATTVASQMTTFFVDAEDVGAADISVTINSKFIETENQTVELNPIND